MRFTNVTMSLLAWQMFTGATSGAEPMVEVREDQVACDRFIGFGAEWDVANYVPCGLTDAEFEVVAKRVRWMRLPVARVMMLTRWCYFDGSRFDWDTPEMRMLYRQLDVCQELGTTVFLTDWGSEEPWTTAPGLEGAENPKYAEVIGAYLDHLIREKGYTCIKYFILVNEPNWQVGDWERWKQGALNVAGVLKKRGLDKQVTLAGSDTSQDGKNEVWHRLAVDQLHHVLGVYDIHRYAQRDRVRSGGLEDYWREQWHYAREHDPKATGKPCIVGEAGMNDDAQHPRGSGHIEEYGYGVFMADYAVQAARVGIPMIPPVDSEGKRLVIPKDSAVLFRLNRSSCSGRIGAQRRGCFNCDLFCSRMTLGMSSGFSFSHGFPLECDGVGVVNESVQNGVGQGGIADGLVPVFDG